MLERGDICESESILLHECLVHISLSSTDALQQQSFIHHILQHPLSLLTSQELTTTIQDQRSFLHLMGVNQEEENQLARPPGSHAPLPPESSLPPTHPRLRRRQLLRALMMCSVVFKVIYPIWTPVSTTKRGAPSPFSSPNDCESNEPHPRSNHRAGASLAAIIPTVLQLLKSISSLWRPDVKVQSVPA